ncbi:MAG: hypothetical protein IJN43_03725 [Ruminococcus sp.]|nr:hypothetical protein [Ruminococcus sp.]
MINNSPFDIFAACILLAQLNLAKKIKTEREFIKEEKRRNAFAFQVFLTQRNFLYVEYLLVRFSWGSNNGDSPQANGSCGLAAAAYKIRFGILHAAA